MITFPLYLLLVFYALFLIVFSLFAAVNIYHISASASFTMHSFIMMALIAFLTIVTVIITIVFLKDVSWTQSVPIFDMTISTKF